MRVLLLTYTLFSLSFCFGQEFALSSLKLNFIEDMKKSEFFDLEHFKGSKRWQEAKRRYDEILITHYQASELPRIPKVIHHIWLGSPLPKYAAQFRKSWIKHHPDWTFVLWTDHPSDEYGEVVQMQYEELAHHLQQKQACQFIVNDIKNLKMMNKKAFGRKAKNYGVKSDILRYEILYYLGGLYVDTDFECLKPVDAFHHSSDLYAGLAYDLECNLYNGLIGSCAKSKALEICVIKLLNRRYRSNSLGYTGPWYFTDCFFQACEISSEKMLALPVSFFYPWPNYHRFQSQKEILSWIKPESFGIHYWKCSWCSP